MRKVLLLLFLAVTAVQCATVEDQEPAVVEEKPAAEAPAPPQPDATGLQALEQRVRGYLDKLVGGLGGQQKADEPGARAGRGGRSKKRDEELPPLAEAFMRRLREQAYANLKTQLRHSFGPDAPQRTESIPLEAIDAEGNVVEIPVQVETRQLRPLTLPANRTQMRALISEEDLTVSLYGGVPSRIIPADASGFVRKYTGQDASAIAMEAKLIVTLKGGEWDDAHGSGRVANAIAVRGLDWTNGLGANTNQRYDDTLFVIMEDGNGAFEVYEYRMTTESSSEKRGVGRLDSKQVTYVRGLHRGKDPAYRLKGNQAAGTRVGMQGEYEITGANMHSAYTRRVITSSTPLKENVSLGCQVVAAGKTPFEKSLVFLLDSKGVKQFPYTIVGNDEIEFFDQSLQGKGKQSILVHAIVRGA